MVKSVIARISNNFRVAAAEVEENDLWQLATIGIATISNDKRRLNEVLSSIIDFVNEAGFDAEVLDYKVEIIGISGE